MSDTHGCSKNTKFGGSGRSETSLESQVGEEGQRRGESLGNIYQLHTLKGPEYSFPIFAYLKWHAQWASRQVIEQPGNQASRAIFPSPISGQYAGIGILWNRSVGSREGLSRSGRRVDWGTGKMGVTMDMGTIRRKRKSLGSLIQGTVDAKHDNASDQLLSLPIRANLLS